MGAGALEAPTSKVRSYPVFDPRGLTGEEKDELVSLARAVWTNEKPHDWAAAGTKPGARLRALDNWLLERAQTGVTAEQVYRDLGAACAARIAVARDKVTTTKKQKTDSIASVARGIAEPIARTLNSRQFPEDFSSASETSTFHIPRGTLRQISMHSFFDTTEVVCRGEGGRPILEGSYNAAVADVIVRAALLGRETFAVPTRREQAQTCVSAFLSWFGEIRGRLDESIAESAVGTGYEDQLRAEVYRVLRVNPHVADAVLPTSLNCAL